jgi:hypothetical protein
MLFILPKGRGRLNLKFKQLLSSMFLLIFLVIGAVFVHLVSADPCAVLEVSLPEAFITGMMRILGFASVGF